MAKSRWILTTLVVVAALAGLATGVFGAKSSKKAQADGQDVAARIGDQVITLEEVDNRAMIASMQAYQALYDARKQALDELVAERLYAVEAKSRGITPEQLISAEIDEKLQAVTDAELEVFYNENKGRMGGKPLEEMLDPIRQYLNAQRTQQRRESFIAELQKTNPVQTLLDAPRAVVKIAENDPRKGPDGAPILLVEFSEFQ